MRPENTRQSQMDRLNAKIVKVQLATFSNVVWSVESQSIGPILLRMKSSNGYLVDALFSRPYHVKCPCDARGHMRQTMVRFVHEAGTSHCSKCLPPGDFIQVYHYTYRPAIAVASARRVYKGVNRITSFVHNGGRVVCLRPIYKGQSSLPSCCLGCRSGIDESVDFCSLQCALQIEGNSADDSDGAVSTHLGAMSSPSTPTYLDNTLTDVPSTDVPSTDVSGRDQFRTPSLCCRVAHPRKCRARRSPLH